VKSKKMPNGRGKIGGFGLGPGGECVCPNCGYKMKHQRGMPCYQQTCPKCGSKMTRGLKKIKKNENCNPYFRK
jgi:PHP family Zn ribbon phosphoesterase